MITSLCSLSDVISKLKDDIEGWNEKHKYVFEKRAGLNTVTVP